jgi:predicted RNA-binding protein YlqC (UPF0109 family)
MKELLTVVIKNLVDAPEDVSIVEKENEKSICYEVKVAKNDMGKVIGKQGKMAKSIRTVMKAVAVKEHKKISIEFVG